ncbi:molybdopterin-dependent oxidoreductase [Roseovarius pacificus]|uniref:molybdopterin-dependent oxidoreductase n=1 Tax=Roseovarius pacificus TaxID=337701 RepID=UPI002A18CF9B|nr:molybdopterin-dependent oxidoreductase [Roseovarius pacificus]
MRFASPIALFCLSVSTAPLVAGESPPVLRISGQLANAPVTLSLADLKAMPVTTLETDTVVTDGMHRFTGVLMRDLLENLEAEGDIVTATALNDYIVDIPMTDFEDFDVIVAYAMDGAALDRADKGPLWIVYPRENHTELQDIRYDYRWVWQLSQLDVR